MGSFTSFLAFQCNACIMKAISYLGAQKGRSGLVWPVRCLLGGVILTGHSISDCLVLYTLQNALRLYFTVKTSAIHYSAITRHI